MSDDKRMERRGKVFAFFAAHGIEYDVYDHPEAHTVEEALKYWRDDGSRYCKNLFLRNHKGDRHYLVVLDGSRSLAIHAVDPDAVICWIGNGHCDPSVTADVSWKTFIGQTSGESYQFEWHGGDNVTVITQGRTSGIR